MQPIKNLNNETIAYAKYWMQEKNDRTGCKINSTHFEEATHEMEGMFDYNARIKLLENLPHSIQYCLKGGERVFSVEISPETCSDPTTTPIPIEEQEHILLECTALALNYEKDWYLGWLPSWTGIGISTGITVLASLVSFFIGRAHRARGYTPAAVSSNL